MALSSPIHHLFSLQLHMSSILHLCKKVVCKIRQAHALYKTLPLLRTPCPAHAALVPKMSSQHLRFHSSSPHINLHSVCFIYLLLGTSSHANQPAPRDCSALLVPLPRPHQTNSTHTILTFQRQVILQGHALRLPLYGNTLTLLLILFPMSTLQQKSISTHRGTLLLSNSRERVSVKQGSEHPHLAVSFNLLVSP